MILVVDTSRSMQAKDVKPTRLGAAQEAIELFLDQASRSAPRRARRLRGRGAGRDAADLRPRPRRAVRRLGRRVPHLRRNGDRRCSAGGSRARQAVRRPAAEVGGADGGAGPGHEIARLAVARAGRRRAVAGPGLRREEPRLDPLPLRRRPDARAPRAAPGRGARHATPAIPVYTVALGTPGGHDQARRFGGFGQGGPNELIPVPPDPETLRAIAEMTGGAVHRGARRRVARVRVREPRLEPRARARAGARSRSSSSRSPRLLLVAAGVLSALWSPRHPVAAAPRGGSAPAAV